MGTSELARSLALAERRRKLLSLSLTLPLLVFLLAVFILPIVALLQRAVENPEVADALPRTAQVLAKWDRTTEPPPAAFAAVAADLAAIGDSSVAGAPRPHFQSSGLPPASAMRTNACRASPFHAIEIAYAPSAIFVDG